MPTAVSNRARFHGARGGLVAVQVEKLGVSLLATATHSDHYETVFAGLLDVLQDHGADDMLISNIHLADIRAWHERRTTVRGFHHFVRVWGDAPALLLQEDIDRGYADCFVSIDSTQVQPNWLDARLDLSLVQML
jgi:diphthamide synthase (EF-2-diphthine--ammonia ligase)